MLSEDGPPPQRQLYLNIIWLQNKIPLLEVLNIHHMCQLFRIATLRDKTAAFMPILWINRSVWEKIDTSSLSPLPSPAHASHHTLLNKRTNRQVEADEMFPQIIQRIPQEWKIFIRWIDVLLPFGTPVIATDRIRYNRQMIPVFIYEEVREKFLREFPTICRLLEINTELPSFTPQEPFSTPFPMVQLASCYYKMLTLYHFPGLYGDTGDVLNLIMDLQIRGELPNFSCGCLDKRRRPIFEDFLILSCDGQMLNRILSAIERKYQTTSYSEEIYFALDDPTDPEKILSRFTKLKGERDLTQLTITAQNIRKTLQDFILFVRKAFPDIYVGNAHLRESDRVRISYREACTRYPDSSPNWELLFKKGYTQRCVILNTIMDFSFYYLFVQCVGGATFSGSYLAIDQTSLSQNFSRTAFDELRQKRENGIYTYCNPASGWCAYYAWCLEQVLHPYNLALLPYFQNELKAVLLG